MSTRLNWKLSIVIALVLAVMLALDDFSAPVVAQDTPLLPLAERGPNHVGQRTITLVDDSRADREIVLELWYPALLPPDSDTDLEQLAARHMGMPDAAPDRSKGPYPLVLYSHGLAGHRRDLAQYTEPLASHGFVVVGVNHDRARYAQSAIDRGLDILFVVNQMASTTDDNLAGLIDTNSVGVMGWSDGAYTALLVNGARIDPVSARRLTENPWIPRDWTDPRTSWTDWDWDALTAYRAQFTPPLVDGELWPPFTDERIRAVIAFEPCYTPLFGAQGLAAATVPTLLVGGTADQFCPYEHDAVFDYRHLSAEDVYLLTIIDGDHFTFTDPNYEPPMTHLIVALFGRFLQGNEAYAQYLTSEYVQSMEDQLDLGLYWGVYEGE